MRPEGRRGPGRPRGATARGEDSRRRLYETALRLINERGWEATTLRDVAREAGVSVGLLYRYFPSKRAVVLTLYDELSARYAAQAESLPTGRWRDRFMAALRTSLAVLGPHRATLASLTPILVGNAEEGVFAPTTAFSRTRVQAVFLSAVAGASDAPGNSIREPLGRLLYLLHLAVILWWLLDKSPGQRATSGLLSLLDRALPLAAISLNVPGMAGLIRTADTLSQDALLGEHAGRPAQ